MPKFSAPDKGYPDNLSYTTDGATYAVGATSVNLVAGTGEIVAGDTVQFAGDPNSYVVATGAAGPGAITLAAPGLGRPLVGSTAVTVTSVPKEDGVLHHELAAIYNGLQTEAAQAHFVSTPPGLTLGHGLMRHYGVAFHQWLNGILGLAKPAEYSGPAGVAEIATTAVTVKAAQDAAAARAKAAEAKAAADAAKVPAKAA
jgi:hypothetical protein